MPDLSDYFKLGRAAQALGGPGPGMPAGPINPDPAAQLGYGRPRGGFPQLAGLNDNWRNRGLPEELQPLAGDAAPSEAESALSAAIRGRAEGPAAPPVAMPPPFRQAPGDHVMPALATGGNPFQDAPMPSNVNVPAQNAMPPASAAAPMVPAGRSPSMLDQWQQGLMASANEPIMMAGGFQAPHKWGVGPVRMMGESQTQANARDEADYAGRMDQAKTAYAGAQAQGGMMLGARGQQMNALNDLLKEQMSRQPTDMQQAHLGLEKDKLALDQKKQKFTEEQVKGDEPRRKAMIDKLTMDNMQKNPGAPAEEAAALARKQAEAIMGPSGTAGKDHPAQADSGPLKPGSTVAELIQRLPESVLAMTAKDAEGKMSARSAEDFMNKFYQLDQSGQLPKGTNINDVIQHMKRAYGPGSVDEAMRQRTVLGMPADRIQNALAYFTGEQGGVTKENAARAAFRQSMGLDTGTDLPNSTGSDFLAKSFGALTPFGPGLGRLMRGAFGELK